MSNGIHAPSGLEHFLNKSSIVSGLHSDDIRALLRVRDRALEVKNGRPLEDIADPDCVFLVEKGLITQSCLSGAERLPVSGYFIAGDIANLPKAFGEISNAAFYAHPGTSLYIIKSCDLLEATSKQPRLLRIFLREVAGEARRAKDALINLGARRASGRLAHFFLDFAARLEDAGLKGGGSYQLPFNQSLLSQTLGMSVVHTNRSYRNLERAGLVTIRSRQLFILNYDGLCQIAGWHGKGQGGRIVSSQPPTGDEGVNNPVG